MTKILLLLILIFLNSCSFDQGLLREIYNSYSQKDFKITSDIYNNQPYSFATFSIGNSNKIILILWKIDNGRYFWVSQDSQIITTYHGKIIEAVGFSNDIKVTSLANDFFKKSQIFYKTDFFEPNLLGINSKSIFNSLKIEEKINIGFQEIMTTVYIEEYLLSDVNFSGKNYYYFKDAMPRKTIQKIHPFLDHIEMVFYYK